MILPIQVQRCERRLVTELQTNDYAILDNMIVQVTNRKPGLFMGRVEFEYTKANGVRGSASWRNDMMITVLQ